MRSASSDRGEQHKYVPDVGGPPDPTELTASRVDHLRGIQEVLSVHDVRRPDRLQFCHQFGDLGKGPSMGRNHAGKLNSQRGLRAYRVLDHPTILTDKLIIVHSDNPLLVSTPENNFVASDKV